MKPVVDGIEEEFRGDLRVLRVDIDSPNGRMLKKRYQAYFTPTFIFFDSMGVEQWRSTGNLDREQIERYLQGAR